MPTPDRDKPSEPERLSAVQKAFRIIEAITNAGAPISMTEIERITGLTRPTVHRVANSLIEMRYVERDEQSRAITEGRRLVALALGVLRSHGPRALRLDILRGLARETGESCHFAVLNGTSVRLVDQVGAPVPLAVRYDDMDELPVHSSACGRLLLAQLPEARRDRLLSDMAGLATAERRRLMTLLREISATGIGTENGDHIAGVGGLAVPVRLPCGRSAGSLGLAAPTSRLGATERARFVPLLQGAASRLAAIVDAGADD